MGLGRCGGPDVYMLWESSVQEGSGRRHGRTDRQIHKIRDPIGQICSRNLVVKH